jgi:fatty acid desaturase
MMADDHRAWLKGLPEDLLAGLSTRSDGAGLLHLAGHMGLVLLCGALIGLGVPGWWLLLPVHGILLVFLFTLEHETTHQTPFATVWLNEIVGRFCGLVMVLPFLWFRYFHLAHHRWTNMEGKDPELAGTRPRSLRGWTWHVSGLPYWIASIRLIAALAAGKADDTYLPHNARTRIVREARIMLLVYAGIAATFWWSPLVLWIWLLPVLIGQPFLRLYLLAEHGDCPHVVDMFQNTRTTFTNRIVRFLAWNMPYHVEHHVVPAVPFHRLPELHLLMHDQLAVTADSYSAFTRDYLARRTSRPGH